MNDPVASSSSSSGTAPPNVATLSVSIPNAHPSRRESIYELLQDLAEKGRATKTRTTDTADIYERCLFTCSVKPVSRTIVDGKVNVQSLPQYVQSQQEPPKFEPSCTAYCYIKKKDKGKGKATEEEDIVSPVTGVAIIDTKAKSKDDEKYWLSILEGKYL